MKEEQIISALWAFLKRNAFKIFIIVVLLFLAGRKEFSFSINMNAPDRKPVKTQEKVKESYTENRVPHQEAAVTDRLELPNWWNKGGSTPSAPPQPDEAAVTAYIRRFAHVAEEEQSKFGIPASITMANSLYQSNAGQSVPARDANNQFGLPCTTDWLGETAKYQGNCLRKYENAWTSFRDHSYFITTGRFAPLKSLNDKDYKGWARSLEKLGYNQQKGLASELIRIIEKYQLNLLDE